MEKQKDTEEIKYLRNLGIKAGSTLYTEVTKVAPSGMSRHIRVFYMKQNEPQDITHTVAEILGDRYDKDGMVVRGCGMDMGFDTVYNLSMIMFPKGFTCTGEYCGGTEHVNEHTPRDKKAHHNEGGYALKQRWL